MGHFARGTNDVVPVEECPVHAGRANRIAFALRDALAAAGIPAAGVGTDGLARHVVVRTSRDEKEAVAMLVATRDDPALQAPLRALLDGAEKPEGLVLNLHDRPGPWLVGRESKRVAGTGHVKEEALGPAFLVSPASFFQTNVAAAATLVRLVAEALPGETRPARPRSLQRRRALRPAPRAARPLGHRGRGEPQERAGRGAQPPPERRERGPVEARVLVGGEGAALPEGRGLRRRRPRPAAGGLPAGGDPRGLRTAEARPRRPRLLRPRGPRARAAARRGGRLPRRARPARGHVSPHAAHGVGHRPGAPLEAAGPEPSGRPHATYTVFTFTNSRIPNAPSSRP